MDLTSELAKLAAGRCWDGYEPVPGKGAYTDDSCRKIGSKKKKKSEKKADDCDHCGKDTKKAFDVSSMANRAIQSPLGQGALNAGAGVYNKLPSQMRNRMGAYAMQAGGLNNQNVANWKMPGFTPDPSQGTGIKSNTVAKTRQQGNQINESFNQKIRSMRPGYAGSPMSQLARGVMAGQMPNRTFPQGTPVANKMVVKNDQLKQDKIVPQAAYNRFTRGMGKGGSDIQALDKAAASAAWQRKAGKNSKGGLNEKGRKSYERENPGSDLKAPVTGKVKPGGKAAKRRKSFCARMKGNKGPMKKPNGEPTRKALSLRKWKCGSDNQPDLKDNMIMEDQLLTVLKEKLAASCGSHPAPKKKKKKTAYKVAAHCHCDKKGCPKCDAKREKESALKGDQHKLDVDKDGKIESSDLKKLRGRGKNEKVALDELRLKLASHVIKQAEEGGASVGSILARLGLILGGGILGGKAGSRGAGALVRKFGKRAPIKVLSRRNPKIKETLEKQLGGIMGGPAMAIGGLGGTVGGGILGNMGANALNKESALKQARRGDIFLSAMLDSLKSFGKKTALPAAGTGAVGYGVGNYHGYQAGKDSLANTSLKDLVEQAMATKKQAALKGDQHKLDVDKDGKIEGSDLKKLRGRGKTKKAVAAQLILDKVAADTSMTDMEKAAFLSAALKGLAGGARLGQGQ